MWTVWSLVLGHWSFEPVFDLTTRAELHHASLLRPCTPTAPGAETGAADDPVDGDSATPAPRAAVADRAEAGRKPCPGIARARSDAPRRGGRTRGPSREGHRGQAARRR